MYLWSSSNSHHHDEFPTAWLLFPRERSPLNSSNWWNWSWTFLNLRCFRTPQQKQHEVLKACKRPQGAQKTYCLEKTTDTRCLSLCKVVFLEHLKTTTLILKNSGSCCIRLCLLLPRMLRIVIWPKEKGKAWEFDAGHSWRCTEPAFRSRWQNIELCKECHSFMAGFRSFHRFLDTFPFCHLHTITPSPSHPLWGAMSSRSRRCSWLLVETGSARIEAGISARLSYASSSDSPPLLLFSSRPGNPHSPRLRSKAVRPDLKIGTRCSPSFYPCMPSAFFLPDATDPPYYQS